MSFLSQMDIQEFQKNLNTSYFFLQVIYARRLFGISPPKISGPPEFERIFRAQVNSSEYFPIFLALLWQAGLFFHQGKLTTCCGTLEKSMPSSSLSNAVLDSVQGPKTGLGLLSMNLEGIWDAAQGQISTLETTSSPIFYLMHYNAQQAELGLDYGPHSPS
ncbi:hypothetical protein DUI87_26798 [Hirundo rustica rustica]|uniref:Uncharacterized protein n=1 Tax=Hirundo rustica rustica TaxID=333673 RepID=A0A3M0JCV0_HIRRU|nr:hypothetical protein DUI87_26798 [Hirundo rustica rustica]